MEERSSCDFIFFMTTYPHSIAPERQVEAAGPTVSQRWSARRRLLCCSEMDGSLETAGQEGQEARADYWSSREIWRGVAGMA